jgi:hypothetical protein
LASLFMRLIPTCYVQGRVSSPQVAVVVAAMLT